jgi:hypothetical protein
MISHLLSHFPLIYWVLGLILIFYLGLPLVIWLQQKMPAQPVLEELEFNHLTARHAEFLTRHTAALYDLGFDEPTIVQIPKPMANVSCFLVMMVNRKAGHKATVSLVIGHGAVPIETSYVEYNTRFEAEETFNTLNSKELMAFRPGPSTVRTQVPSIESAEELYRVHEFVIDAQGVYGNKLVYEKGKALDYLANVVFIKTYERQVERGLMWHDSRHDVYRFTMKGAYLVTWGLLPPFKALRMAAMRRRGARLVEEFHASQSV